MTKIFYKLKKNPFCVLLFIMVSFVLFLSASVTPKHMVGNIPFAQPPYFYYQGKLYIYRGSYQYSLPNGFQIIGESDNVGKNEACRDLEGNVDGYVYMSSCFYEGAYLQQTDWNEERDGGENPYLYFEYTP